MRWARVALYSFLGLFGLLVIAAILLLTMDLGRFKGTTEDLLSDLLEREFRIDGEFQVHVGRHIRIVADDVSLAGAQWGTAGKIASVGHLAGTVDTWSLIRGPILIESLQIDNARVHLESNDAGEDNWTFFPPTPEDEIEETEPEERPRLPVMLDDAEINDFKLTYDSPERPRPFQFTAVRVRAEQTADRSLRVDLDGDINSTPLALALTVGPVDNLVDFYEVDFLVAGNLGEIQIDGEAQFGNLIRPRRPTIRLSIKGPNAEYLTGILRVQQMTTGSLDLTASISPVGEKMQLLVNGAFGEFSLDATGGFVNLQELQDVDLRVAASGPDASKIAALLGNDKVPEDPFSIVGNFTRSGSELTADDIRIAVGKTQFEIGGYFGSFPDPRDATARIRVVGPDFGRFNKLLGLPGRLQGPFKLDADLAPIAEGGARVDLHAVAQDIRLSVVGNVTDDPQFIGTRVDVNFNGPNLQIVALAGGLEDAPAEPFDVRVLVDTVQNGFRIEQGTLKAGDDQLDLEGLVGNRPLEADTDIRFEMTGPDIAATLAAFGRDADELPTAQFRVAGRVERGAENFLLHDVRAAIGDDLEYQLTVDGELSTSPKLEGTRLRVNANGASLGALTDAAGIEGIPHAQFSASANVEIQAAGYLVENGSIHIADDVINVDGLIGEKPLERGTDVRFSASAPDLRSTLQSFSIEAGAVPPGKFSAAGQLRHRGDYFALQNLTASLAGANLNLSGRLGALPDLNGTNLELGVNGADLSRLLPADRQLPALAVPYGMSAKIEVLDDVLSIEKLDGFAEKARLAADLKLSLSPLLQHGEYSIDASAEDMYKLLPGLADVGVPERAPLELHTDGSWLDNFWTLDNFYLQLGEGNITASGTVDGPPSFDRTDLEFDWNVSSVRSLSVLAGRELPDDEAHLKFHLTGTNDLMTLEDFSAAIGDSDILGDFSMTAGEVPRIHVGFSSDRLNLAPYLPEPAEEVRAAGEPAPQTPKKEKRVIPDTPIDLDVLRKFILTVDIRIAELLLRHRALVDIELAGAVEDGALRVDNFGLRNTDGGSMSGQFAVEPGESGAELLLAINGSGLHLGMPADTAEAFEALPRYDLDTVLSGNGRTVRELAGSLNGYVRLVGGAGRLKANALRFFTSDFLSEVLTTVNPFAKTDPYTNFQCTTVLLRLEDGVVSGKPALVSQSERLRIFSNATVDLKTEKLSADINTVPQKGLGLSFSDLVNPYTKLGGTLASPSLALDPEGALIEGGAAVATAGLSILAKRFKDRYLSEKDACGKAVAEADPDFAILRERFYPAEPADN